MLYKFLNWYTSHLPFPHRGWRYFRKLLIFLKLDNKNFKKKLYNGLFAYVSPIDHIQQSLFWYGCYEKSEIATWVQFIKDKQTIVDIGANVGLYSMAASMRAPHGNIYAFEPVRTTRETLIRNIKMNELTNISIFPFAVSQQNSKSRIYHGDETNVSMSSLTPPENYRGSWEPVETIILDDFLQEAKPDIIKIDVEGAELDVLAGMKGLLERCQPVLFIEVIDTQLKRFNASKEALYDFLEERHYRPFLIAGEGILAPAKNRPESYTVVFVSIDHEIPKSITIRDN